MTTKNWKGRDFLAETDFTREEIETVLEVAADLKDKQKRGIYHDDILRAKTLFMIFYNQSLRTRNSFEAGMTQLGGHAHYLDPSKIYTPAMEGREVAYSTERVSDVARVLDRMGDAIAIRCYGDPVDWEYGGAHAMLREFAKWADIPVLNMEDDIYHPFQGLADAMTVKERFGGFQGVNYTMSWAYSPSVHKPRAVPQSAILYAAMLGMNVTLAHPEGMKWIQKLLPNVNNTPKPLVENSASPTSSRMQSRVHMWSIQKHGVPPQSSRHRSVNQTRLRPSKYLTSTKIGSARKM
jgi:ornithine carbamoyltransferase